MRLLVMGVLLVAGAIFISNSPATERNPEADNLGSIRSVVLPATVKDASRFLESLCPGQIVGKPNGLGCNNWGSDAFPDDDVQLPHAITGVLKGHFLSPISDDVLLSGDRGESHLERFGGSLLVSRIGSDWKPLWYRSGVISNRCAKATLPSGREIPICESSYMAGGHLTHDIFAFVIMPTGVNRQLLISADTYAWPDRLQKQTIDKVEIVGDRNKVIVRLSLENARAANKGGADFEGALRLRANRYILEFFLDGTTFSLTPASAVAFNRLFPGPLQN